MAGAKKSLLLLVWESLLTHQEEKFLSDGDDQGDLWNLLFLD